MDRPNFEAPLALTDLEFWRDSLVVELLERLRLTFASIDPTRAGHGIVDAEDPATATPTSGRALAVSVNVANPTTVDVNGGVAVCPNGERIIIPTIQTQIPLANLAGNVRNVVYLYFAEQDSPDTALTHADTLVSLRYERLSNARDYIRSLSITDYLMLTSAETSKVVPLAVVSVEVTGTGNTLIVDMGTTLLSGNRPWFTAVDLRHRQQLGTGVPTQTNPHGTALSDLSATAGKTIFQLMLEHGMIVGKDLDIAKVPGFICSEIVQPSAVFVDTTGAFTGVIGARYFRLSRFPVNLLDATNALGNRDYALARLPNTNICFMNPNEPWDGSATTILYTAVSAAEPPATLNPISMTLRQPQSTEEAMIAGGVGLSLISQPTLSFADAGQVPAIYVAYVGSDGRVDKYPQVVVTQRKLSEVGGALQTITIPAKGRARVRIALTKATAGALLAVSIRVTGRANGIVVTDTLNFGTSWSEPASYPACGDYPSMYATGTVVFDELTSYIVLTRTNDGPLSEILMWAMIDPIVTPELQDVLPVADINWDALKICRMEDIRPIATTVSLPRTSKLSDGAKAIANMTPILLGAGYLFNFWLEDFDRPTFVGTTYREMSATFEPGAAVTNIRKIGDGLDSRSVYVGRPVAVKPHSAAPFALRIVPIEPGRNSSFRIRVMVGAGTWSRWYQNIDLSGPSYTLFLSALGGAPLRKWQLVATGVMRGIVVTYVTSTPDTGHASLVLDVGAYDEGLLG